MKRLLLLVLALVLILALAAPAVAKEDKPDKATGEFTSTSPSGANYVTTLVATGTYDQGSGSVVAELTRADGSVIIMWIDVTRFVRIDECHAAIFGISTAQWPVDYLPGQPNYWVGWDWIFWVGDYGEGSGAPADRVSWEYWPHLDPSLMFTDMPDFEGDWGGPVTGGNIQVK